MIDLFSDRITNPPIPLSKLEIKALVRHRDNYCCTECGMTAERHIEAFGRNLDVHRVTPGSKYTLSGCVTLCRPCHKAKPKRSRGTGDSGGTLRIPEPYASCLRRFASHSHRSVTAEAKIALERHFVEEGVDLDQPADTE